MAKKEKIITTLHHDVTILDDGTTEQNTAKSATIPELARTNELANKAKTQGLNEAEQASLRKVYLQRFRGQVNSLMASITVQDKAGIVTM